MRRFGTLHRLIARRTPSRGFGWKLVAAACFIASAGATLVVNRSIRPRAMEQTSSSMMNHTHLMESMIAHARVSGGAAPGSIISGMARTLAVGSPAPAFTLPKVRGGGKVSLSSFRGRPVVLVFGSFSCVVFYDRVAEIERLHRAYKDRAAFLFVNITEAGHRIPGLEFVIDPATPSGPDPLDDRRRRVDRALRQTNMTLPGVLDFEQAVEAAYDAYPTRLVAVDADGKVALDIGRGMSARPWAIGELEEWLKTQPRPREEQGSLGLRANSEP
jgi:hypothetical protein